jgi:hypothetical protein
MRCVAGAKTESGASKMFGTNRWGLRSITGNHVLWICTITRWPLRNTWSLAGNRISYGSTESAGTGVGSSQLSR